MFAKAGLGLLGIGALGTGAVIFIKPEWMGMKPETPWKPLSHDDNYETAGYSGKFGDNFKNYFVGTSQNNKDWWEEKEKTITGEKRGKFKNIQGGFDGESSLKSLCDEAYKQEKTALKSGSDEPSDTEFKKADVWKYCSTLGQRPSTVQTYDRKTGSSDKKYENSEGKTPIGQAEEASLVSVNDESNTKFWKLRNEEFYGRGLFTTKGRMDVNSSHTFFHKAKENDKESIRELCRRAYNMDSDNKTSSESAPTKDETKKYCSLTNSSNTD